ncbi:hypothetical protein BKA70DRAFT_1430359 [Coprinopsis sp. MPI-PUGE-AT-0042]|nr:hypothetical protein BKA70DRAFT_1430359 [Coprinopsis sp. MPI-PUGE-AT-0042]
MSNIRYGSSVSEKDLEELVAEVCYFSRTESGSFPPVKCAFFRTHCLASRIVPVAVHRGYEKNPRPVDLFHRFYVSTFRSSHNGVVKYDEFTIPIDTNSELNPTPWNFTIFFSNAVSVPLSNPLVFLLATQ